MCVCKEVARRAQSLQMRALGPLVSLVLHRSVLSVALVAHQKGGDHSGCIHTGLRRLSPTEQAALLPAVVTGHGLLRVHQCAHGSDRLVRNNSARERGACSQVRHRRKQRECYDYTCAPQTRRSALVCNGAMRWCTEHAFGRSAMHLSIRLGSVVQASAHRVSSLWARQAEQKKTKSEGWVQREGAEREEQVYGSSKESSVEVGANKSTEHVYAV